MPLSEFLWSDLQLSWAIIETAAVFRKHLTNALVIDIMHVKDVLGCEVKENAVYRWKIATTRRHRSGH